MRSSSSTQAWRLGRARRLHQTSSWKPSAQVGWLAARRIGRSRALFSCVLGVGAGDPLLGPLPADAQAADGLADGLVTDSFGGNAFSEAHLSRQLQRPDAGRLAKGARAPVQQRPQVLTADSVHLG